MRAFFISILIFSLLSLLIYCKVPQLNAHQDIDSKAYIQRGTLFAHNNSFKITQTEQQPYYALGYAFVIGILFKLFGCNIAVIILFQLLISLLSCLLISRISHDLFGQRAAWISGIFFAINVGYLTFTQFILTEVLLSFFLVLFFQRFIVFQKTKSKWILIQSALTLGLSIIVKPAAIFFVLVVMFLLLFQMLSSRTRSGIYALFFTLFFYLPVIGYMTFNKYEFGNFCISTLDKVNLYYWFFPNVLAAQNNTTSNSERTRLIELSGGGHNFAAIDNLFFDSLKKHPLLFVRVWLLNVFKTLVGLYTTNLKVLLEPAVHGGSVSYFKMQGSLLHKAWAYITAGATNSWIIAVGALEALWSFIRYILCFLGLYALLKRKQYFFFLLCVAFIGYFALITGHDGCARFRMMFEFLLIVLAAGGVSRIIFLGKNR